MLENGQLRNLGLIPGWGKRFSFVQSIHTKSGANQPFTQCIPGALFPTGWGGLGYHSPPPRAESMKECSYTSNTPHAFMGYVGTTLLHYSTECTLIFSLPPHIIYTYFLLRTLTLNMKEADSLRMLETQPNGTQSKNLKKGSTLIISLLKHLKSGTIPSCFKHTE
jgi:hypothetical protein